MARIIFEELEDLNDELIKMGILIEEAIENLPNFMCFSSFNDFFRKFSLI